MSKVPKENSKDQSSKEKIASLFLVVQILKFNLLTKITHDDQRCPKSKKKIHENIKQILENKFLQTTEETLLRNFSPI